MNILGVGVDPVNQSQTLATIDKWAFAGEKKHVCLASLDNVLACHSSPELRDLFNESGLTVPDDMPLVWLSWLSGYPRADRVYGPDLLETACRSFVERGHSHYFFGGASGVAEALANKMQDDNPGIQIAGWDSPPSGVVAPEARAAHVERINTAGPDILWVALESPHQERWMAENRAALNARVLIGVGPAFDFLTGAKPQPPRWARRIGFEWLIRLSTEPKRMGRRYLRYPLFLLWYSMQLAGLRRYPKPPQPQAAPPLAIDKLPLVIEPTRAEILGVQVGAWEMENLEAYILRTVKSGTRARVFNVNAHALNLAYEQPEVAAAFREAEVGFPDGFGAVLAARLLGTYIRSRVTYADWFWRVAALCEHHGLRIFFLGGRPGVAERAKNALQRVHPGFKVVGCRHGYFDHAAGSEDTKRVVAEINRAQTDLLVVGLGMPLQETWLTQNWGQIEAAVGLTGGAVFDYVSGRLRRPPRLLTDHGLEWLGRMLIEPGRLWRRYLLGNPKFLWRVMRQRLQR